MIFNRIEKKYNGRAVIFHQVLFKPIRITLQKSYAMKGRHRPPPALSEKKPRQFPNIFSQALNNPLMFETPLPGIDHCGADLIAGLDGLVVIF